MTPAGPAAVVTIRPARPDDRETLVAYNAALARETEGKALDPDTLARGVAAALADPDRLRYWVAEWTRDAAVIGQAAVTPEWSDWRAGWIWWLQSVYVREDARGAGVFRALLEHIRAEARARGDVVGLRLYVEEENSRARAAYESLGLHPGGYLVYEEPLLGHFPHPGESGGIR
jgi:GNAT superfamily N-acetyltransferase